MYAIELINRDVVRSKPNAIGDYSFSDHPIRIISVKPVIKFEYADDWHRRFMDTDQHSLGHEWNDDGWVEI